MIKIVFSTQRQQHAWAASRYWYENDYLAIAPLPGPYLPSVITGLYRELFERLGDSLRVPANVLRGEAVHMAFFDEFVDYHGLALDINIT